MEKLLSPNLQVQTFQIYKSHHPHSKAEHNSTPPQLVLRPFPPTLRKMKLHFPPAPPNNDQLFPQHHDTI